jgi:type IV secretory pathway VirJ component
VIGVNSLAYFHRPRSAAEAAGLIRDGIARTRAFAPGAPLVLIGQSFGADMLQVGLARMPPPQRRGIALVALVVPSRQVRMQASPGGLIAVDGPGFDGLSTAQALGWAPTLCISGEAERTSLCPSLRQANVARLALPGGHLLRFDADRLAAALLAAIDRATDPRPESAR